MVSVSRLLRSAATLWMALTLVFILVRLLPGDSISTELRQSGASEAFIDEQRTKLCLNCPIHEQYFNYWEDLLQGDWGFSIQYQQSVTTIIADRFLSTFSLAMMTVGIAIVIGFALGIGYAFADGIILRLIDTMIVASQAIPIYFTAIVFIYIFSIYLDLLPAVGSDTPAHLVLPASALGFHIGGNLARVLGTNLKEIWRADFMVTARAKGLPPVSQLDHAMRHAIQPVLSILALQVGFLLGGTVIIEFLFVRRGLGTLMYDAVLNRDYPIVQGLVIISAVIYLFINGLAEQISLQLNPLLNQTHEIEITG